jgi:L-2-hydroxyglutarate oxidase LhgO
LGDYDVAVIGGGIVGSMIARELSRLEVFKRQALQGGPGTVQAIGW